MGQRVGLVGGSEIGSWGGGGGGAIHPNWARART